MKILIVCYDFPPVNRSASLRPYGFAKYWSQAGHNVRVLTTPPNRLGVPQSAVSDFNALNQLDITTVAGLPGLIEAPANDQRVSIKWRIKTLIRNMLIRSASRLRLGSLSNPSRIWIRPARLKFNDIVLNWHPDVVVSSFPPSASHEIVAAGLGDLPSFVWVADYRDLWSNGDLEPTGRIVAKIEQWRELRILKRASLIVTISEPFVRYLANLFPDKQIEACENGFDPDDLAIDGTCPPLLTRLKLTHRVLVYTGTIGLDHRYPAVLLRALEMLKENYPSLGAKLKIVFFTRERELVGRLIAEHQLGDMIVFGDYLDRSSALAAQRLSDGLLFLDWNNPDIKGVLTGKLFEYINAGRTILCVGGPADSHAGQIINDAGLGCATGTDVPATVEWLKCFVSGQEQQLIPNKQVIERFNRKRLAAELLVKIEAHVLRKNA